MRKILKILFYGILICPGAGILIISVFTVRYKIITAAKPGKISVSYRPGELGQWVDPFIGTGGFPAYTSGDNAPGPAMPFGMVRLSPDTKFFLEISGRPNTVSTAGYYYGDNRLIGFSHTRLTGTGASEGGHFRVLPGNGPGVLEKYRKGRYPKFSHSNEIAFPGYYALELAEGNILAELTATEHTGVHRYTFRGDNQGRILVDISSTMDDSKATGGTIRIFPGKNEFEGSVITFGSFARRYGGIKIYCAGRFSRPYSSWRVWKGESIEPGSASASADHTGAEFIFENEPGNDIVELRLGISYVSIENARLNLASESANETFDALVYRSVQAWEDKLALVKVQTVNNDQKQIFYTALYHSLQMPTIFTDVNGDYTGFDKRVHKASGFRYFTDMSLWDTFRTLHPFLCIIDRENQRNMVMSLAKMCEQGGYMPRWPSGYGYTGSMLGASADIMIADTYLRGIRDFDIETAYRAMRKAALAIDIPEKGFRPRQGMKDCIDHRYCPADLMDEAVSKTLEYAYADDALSKLADALGKTDDAKLFKTHSQFYRNTWNKATGYFHPRNSTGEFADKFKPLKLTYFDSDGEYTDDYVEGCAQQWRWAVFFDPEGLLELFGDTAYFVNELNDFFSRSDPSIGKWNPGSYYWHGNEPDIHAAYLFNTAGRPDLTQRWVRWILDNKYKPRYDGLDGDDDAGTLSAWYVLSSLGFYPVAGSDLYQVGTPLFPKAEININGNILTIIAENYSPGNCYVNKVWINGVEVKDFRFRHSDIAGGGVIRFEMKL